MSCSTGWAFWYNLSFFKGLGLEFYDFHEYQDNPLLAASPPGYFGALLTAATLNMDKPILIGECGQYTAARSDSIQESSLINYLNGAKSNGYAGAEVWGYGVSAYPSSTDYLSINNWNLDAQGNNVISFKSPRPVCVLIQAWNYSSLPVAPWGL